MEYFANSAPADQAVALEENGGLARCNGLHRLVEFNQQTIFQTVISGFDPRNRSGESPGAIPHLNLSANGTTRHRNQPVHLID